MKRLSKRERKDIEARRSELRRPDGRGGIRITRRGLQMVKRALRYVKRRHQGMDPRKDAKAEGFDNEREGFVLWSLRDRRWHHTKIFKSKVGFSTVQDLVDKKLICRRQELPFKGVLS